jgi:hypothetical protein
MFDSRESGRKAWSGIGIGLPFLSACVVDARISAAVHGFENENHMIPIKKNDEFVGKNMFTIALPLA